MNRVGRVAGVVAAISAGILLSGCAVVDQLIWGSDGAAVIQMTESLIDAAAVGEAGAFVCADHAPELREPEDWVGLSAEEPEGFVAEYWPELESIDPAWSINLSLPGDRISVGEEFPGDVFYQETDDGLCLIAVSWSTVEAVG